MNHLSGLYNRAHFSRYNRQQSDLVYGTSHSSNPSEPWNGDEYSCYGLGSLDVNDFQPTAAFEPGSGSPPPNFTMEFSSSQWISHMATFSSAENGYSGTIWTEPLHEATGAPNWLPAPNAIATNTNFMQGDGSQRMITHSMSNTAPVPPHDIQSPFVSSSPTALEPTANECLGPVVYVLQRGLEPFPMGEIGVNPVNNNVL